MDLLDGLNPEQRNAVEHSGGPLLVLAGAGSGKTRVLTCRIAQLLRSGSAGPDEVLAVTFTNKAAAEIRERVARLVGGSAAQMWLGTFHSICVRILRRHVAELGAGYDRSFVIYDDDDQLGLLESCLEGQSLPAPARALLSRIDQAKNEAQTPQALLATAATPLDVAAAEAYARYQTALRRNNALDFGDLLLVTLELFERRPALADRYRQSLRVLLVDEYQDTNRAQYRLLKELAAHHRNVCAVGDEDQSIYGWRGADIRNILDFEKDYPEATVIRLEQNYRSTSSILAVAGALIRNNRDRRGKTLWTANAEGLRPVLYHAEDDQDEARFVVREIAAANRPLGEFVVFYRTNAQSRVLEEECLRSGVAYALVGGTRFYERKEVKDLLAYLRATANASDEWSLLRILNVPARGIGPLTAARLVEEARRRSFALWNVLRDPPEILSAGLREKVASFVGLVDELRSIAAREPIATLVEEVIRRTAFVEWLRGKGGPDAESRVENLRELSTVAAEADTSGWDLHQFLDQVALVSDADALQDSRERITLMTLHTSKGLEFPVVFLLGLEEGLLPHRRSLEAREALEEERRLCYVGMTRARQALFLTRARRRRVFGSDVENPPSRFLREISGELLDVRFSDGELPGLRRFEGRTIDYGESQLSNWGAQRPAASARPASKMPITASRPKPSFPVGARVRHPTLGEGVVRATEGAGDREKVTVLFGGFGIRKLVVAVARLELA